MKKYLNSQFLDDARLLGILVEKDSNKLM